MWTEKKQKKVRGIDYSHWIIVGEKLIYGGDLSEGNSTNNIPNGEFLVRRVID